MAFTTMSNTQVGLQSASTAMNLLSIFMQGSATNDLLTNDMNIATANAQRTRNSLAQLDVGQYVTEYDTKKAFGRLQGSQQAGYGKSGVTMEGTPLLVMMQTAREAEDQLQRIRYGFNIQRQNAYAQIADFMNQASQYKQAKKQNVFNTILGAVSSAASTAAKIAMV